jgi:hypothetical protein
MPPPFDFLENLCTPDIKYTFYYFRNTRRWIKCKRQVAVYDRLQESKVKNKTKNKDTLIENNSIEQNLS